MPVSISLADGVEAFLLVKQIAEGKWTQVDAQLKERAVAIVERNQQQKRSS